jgi:hypothetical protein
MSEQSVRILYYASEPPMRDGGHGGPALAWDWLEAMRPAVALIVFQQGSRTLDPGQVLSASGVRSVQLADTARIGLKRFPLLRIPLEILLFVLSLPRIRRELKHQPLTHLFAFQGATLLDCGRTVILKKLSGLPAAIYMLDDIEASAVLHRRWRLIRPVLPRLESWLLRHFDQVFVISEGYVDHLKAKYNLEAKWLPVPVELPVEEPPREKPRRRQLTFLGSISELYSASLVEIAEALVEFNAGLAQQGPEPLYLHVLTLSKTAPLLAKLSPAAAQYVTVAAGRTKAAVWQTVRGSWGCVLPYSFEPSVRTMVKTSFSTKFTETIVSGTPVLVYGPPEASIPRYFREHQLPVLVTQRSRPALLRGLAELYGLDREETVGKYRQVVQQLHSNQPDSLFMQRMHEWLDR